MFHARTLGSSRTGWTKPDRLEVTEIVSHPPTLGLPWMSLGRRSVQDLEVKGDDHTMVSVRRVGDGIPVCSTGVLVPTT